MCGFLSGRTKGYTQISYGFVVRIQKGCYNIFYIYYSGLFSFDRK